MRSIKRRAKCIWICIALGCASLLQLNPSWGLVSLSLAQEVQAPCGVLEKFIGDVQILDATRTHLVNAILRTALPCGSWISVNQGWAQVRHRNGPRLNLGPQTFVQFPLVSESSSHPQKDHPQKEKTDHMILYKGQVYVEAGEGQEEFRMTSANGRARVKSGKAILLFNNESDDTQLIALENSATLENRFEPSRKVKVQQGESTDLNFKLLRVIPHLPRSISVASLRPRLSDLRVSEDEQMDAVRVAIDRQERKFANQLPSKDSKGFEEEDDDSDDLEMESAPTVVNRKLASSDASIQQYTRHPHDQQDAALRSHWIKKITGGDADGEKLLYPKKAHGLSQTGKAEGEDPGVKLDLKIQKQEEEEKKRLMDELSRIPAE